MAAIKISPKVRAKALHEIVRRRRVRPAVIRHLKKSIVENSKLGHLLAR